MIRVRPARSQDVPRLMEIASHSPTAARWNLPAYAKLFAPGTPPGLAGLVIEEDGQTMGFLVGRSVDALGEHEWEIENVAVSGPARRRGLGSRLLGEFVRMVRERGGREVFLEVRESNLAARKLYEKWAFVEAGRRKAYYQDPAEDALILRLSFPQTG
jgi:[ribosomal protein S18]-alanine N-acetyltransferase